MIGFAIVGPHISIFFEGDNQFNSCLIVSWYFSKAYIEGYALFLPTLCFHRVKGAKFLFVSL